MHCVACNCELTDVESTRKDVRGNYLDMCTYCYYQIKNEIVLGNNFDLNIVEKYDENIEDD